MKDPSPGLPGDPVEETTIRASYDWASTSPMMAVFETVADAANTEETDLPSLHSSVDPDALDALFRRTTGGTVRLWFQYAGREVVVGSDGTITVTPRRRVG